MSILSQLPNIGTLIAPSYMHSAIRLAYLKKGQGAYGLSIVTLATFLNKYQREEEKDTIEILLQYRSCVQGLSCPIYHNIVTTLDFLKQCASFIEEMKFYHLKTKDLPETTLAQKEMKQILCALYTIPSSQDNVSTALQHIKTKTLKDVYIMDAYYTHREEQILQILQDAKAMRISFEEKRTQAQFFHAINKRKEVESMAQHIVKENQRSEDINIIVCDPTYKALIAQVFHRYLIPYTTMKESSTSIITKRFVLLLQYYQNPSIDTLIELIQCNTFKAPYLQDLVTYLQIFEMRLDEEFIHVLTQGQESELVSSKELAQLRIVEEHAQLAKDEIWPLLEKLLQASTLKDIFQQVNEIASATIKASDTKHIQTLKQLHSLIVIIAEELHDKTDLEFAIDILSSVQESATTKQLQGICISDVNAPLPPRKITYVVGCTQKNYPATPILHGLFDEAYVKEIPTYPTMRQRYDHHMKQITHHLNVGEQLYVFYPLGNYDGKSNESALEMEQFLDMTSQPYPLYEHYRSIPTKYEIDRESAQALFVQDGVIPGSISSFERYIRCPFAYFLAYGLRLREPIKHQFTPERIGTLTHSILETFVKKYQKEYAHVTPDEIEGILQEELTTMANLYPPFQPLLAITKRRMLHNIEKNMEYLKDMEAHAHLTTCESEHEFWWDLPLPEDVKIRLHGYIDRIDSSSGYARIIDYKSSSKSLMEKEVFSGQKLQLLTYALLVQEQTQKQILGAYYYSLKQENIQMIAGSMKRRPVEYQPCSYEDYATLEHAAHKLQGWTMNEDVDLLDDDATHIYGVRQNKDGVIAARKTYELSVIREHLMSIYQQIGERMLAGDIACTPTEDACMFCPYADICRFRGYPRTIEPLVEVDETIYKGGA